MLTEQQAIRECKELWGEIDKSGLSKADFLYQKPGNLWLKKHYHNDCPLCQYWLEKFIPPKKHTSESISSCYGICPLYLQYGKSCVNLGWSDSDTPSLEWLNAIKGLKE